MQTYRRKPSAVRAVRLTASAFDAPHPNDELVKGVLYDPVLRKAEVRDNPDAQPARVGDWIYEEHGLLWTCDDAHFRAAFEVAD
jgi:hypothetical protein